MTFAAGLEQHSSSSETIALTNTPLNRPDNSMGIRLNHELFVYAIGENAAQI